MNHLKYQINWSKFSGAFFLLLVPAVYSLFRMSLVIQMSDTAINVIAQSSWIGLMFEVIAEGMILPMFYILSQVPKTASASDTDEYQYPSNAAFSEVANTYFTWIMIVSVVFAGIIMIMLPSLTTALNVPQDIRLDTILCNALELVSSVLGIAISYLLMLALFETKDKLREFLAISHGNLPKKRLTVLQSAVLIQLFFSVLVDVLFFSSSSIFDFGIMTPAISSIASKFLIAISLVVLLRKEWIISDCKASIKSKTLSKDYWSRCSLLMIEVIVRNLAFSIMIIKLINTIGEQGTYWMANGFIWSWLLMPCLAISDVIKADGITKETAKSHLHLCEIFCGLFLASIPFWKIFLVNVLGIEDPAAVIQVVLIQTPFYLIFIANTFVDSLFHHLGKSKELLIQSILVNSLYYGGLYVLWNSGSFVPTLSTIALMFGGGILMDFCVTMYQARHILHKFFRT